MGLAILCSDIVGMFNYNCPHENHSYKHHPYKILVNEPSYKLSRTRHRSGVVLKFKFNEIVENIVSLGFMHNIIIFKNNLNV